MLESTIVLFIGLLSIFINIELIRRSHFEALLHYGTFTMVRLRSLGCSKEKCNNIIKNFFIKTFGKKNGAKFYSAINHYEELKPTGLETKFHIRYEAFLKFPYKNQKKHHFEITRKCIYPF